MDVRSVVAEALASTAMRLIRGGLGAKSGLVALARWVAATPGSPEQGFAEDEAVAALGRGDYGYAIALAAASYRTRPNDGTTNPVGEHSNPYDGGLVGDASRSVSRPTAQVRRQTAHDFTRLYLGTQSPDDLRE